MAYPYSNKGYSKVLNHYEYLTAGRIFAEILKEFFKNRQQMKTLEINKESEIINIIKEKAGDTTGQDNNRLLILVGGGGMAGVYSAGVLNGLQTLGLANAFDFAIGVSAGAINLGFFLAGQADLLSGLYCKNFARCVNPFRPWQFYDFEQVEEIIQKKLAEKNCMRTEFYVSVTSVRNGQGRIIDARTNGIVKSIIASALPPLKSGRAIRLGNENYLDGEIGLPLPINESLEKCQMPTHVLVVLNRPYREPYPILPFWQKLPIGIFLFLHAPQLWKKFAFWNSIYRHALKSIEDASNWTNISIISPQNRISETCTNTKFLRKSFQDGFSLVQDLFQ